MDSVILAAFGFLVLSWWQERETCVLQCVFAFSLDVWEAWWDLHPKCLSNQLEKSHDVSKRPLTQTPMPQVLWQAPFGAYYIGEENGAWTERGKIQCSTQYNFGLSGSQEVLKSLFAKKHNLLCKKKKRWRSSKYVQWVSILKKESSWSFEIADNGRGTYRFDGLAVDYCWSARPSGSQDTVLHFAASCTDRWSPLAMLYHIVESN